MKSISYLKPEYFYLLNEKLNTELISMILVIDYTLDPAFRLAFTNIYYRYYCENYFIIKSEIEQSDLNEIKEKIDFNLLTKVDFIINLNNKEINNEINTDYMNINKNSNSNLHPKYMLKPLITNMEIFKLMIVFHDIKFINKTSKIIKYFRNFVLKPVIFIIYKIVYFAKNISAELKYIIYKLIYLFLECYKYFLDLMKASDLNDIHKIIMLDDILYLPFENISDIINFINQTYMKLDLDVKKINSDSFEQLNLSFLMEILSYYLKNFNLYWQLVNKSETEEDCKVREIIKKRKSNYHEMSNSNLHIENDLSNQNKQNNPDNSQQALNTSNNLKENFIENSKDNLVNSLNRISNLKIKHSSIKIRQKSVIL
jgi:hypothetical protein